MGVIDRYFWATDNADWLTQDRGGDFVWLSVSKMFGDHHPIGETARMAPFLRILVLGTALILLEKRGVVKTMQRPFACCVLEYYRRMPN